MDDLSHHRGLKPIFIIFIYKFSFTVQFDTIKTKYIHNAISKFGNVAMKL